MVSSHMAWQAMQASTQSCISLLIGVVVAGCWVMVPPGGRRRPGRPPVLPSYAHFPRSATGRTETAPGRVAGAVPEREPFGYGRLRAMTIRWTWFVPS
ncbi:hypothetical protein GCM10027074_45510 [Streptomyces deserti]